MPDLPVMLRVDGKRCVVLGGGAVAQRRTTSLVDAGAVVTIIAPGISWEPASPSVRIERRPYRHGDLDGALLVVVATDDSHVNQAVTKHAAAAGVLVNRVDDPEKGQITIPAHAHHGPITLAVHTSGISASAAAAIRNRLSEVLDPDWPRLLGIVAPYRHLIQKRIHQAEQRRQRLKQLTAPDAMARLKQQGPNALRNFCQELVTAPIVKE